MKLEDFYVIGKKYEVKGEKQELLDFAPCVHQSDDSGEVCSICPGKLKFEKTIICGFSQDKDNNWIPHFKEIVDINENNN